MVPDTPPAHYCCLCSPEGKESCSYLFGKDMSGSQKVKNDDVNHATKQQNKFTSIEQFVVSSTELVLTVSKTLYEIIILKFLPSV